MMADEKNTWMPEVQGDYQRRVREPARAATSQGLSGGTLEEGAIVPDGQALGPGQMHEIDFIRLLAEELVLRLPTAPPHGEEREIVVRRVQEAIRLIRDRLAAPMQSLEEWLRQRLSIPSASMTPEEFVRAVISRFDPRDLPNLLEIAAAIDSLDAEEEQMRTGQYQPTDDELNSMRAAVGPLAATFGSVAADVAVCMGMCAPCLALSNVNPGYPSDRRIGRLAHLFIQEHYLATHQGHEIVMESYFRWGRADVGISTCKAGCRLQGKIPRADSLRSVVIWENKTA